MPSSKQFIAAIALTLPVSAFAQMSVEACTPLLSGNMLDLDSETTARQFAENRFNAFCNAEGSYVDKFKTSDTEFKASFLDYASDLLGEEKTKLNIGHSDARSRTYIEKSFEKTCNTSSGQYAQFLYTTSQEITGGARLASEFNACIATITKAKAQQPMLTGTVREAGERALFIANFTYLPGNGPADVTLDSIQGDRITCSTNYPKDSGGPEDLRGNWTLSGQASLTCAKENPSQAKTVGAFTFSNEGTETYKRVTYELTNKAAEEQIEETIVSEYQTELDTLRRELTQQIQNNALPDAVAAFDRETCPAGWRKFDEAHGRVLLAAGHSTADGSNRRYQVGDRGGKEDHALTVAEMPKHQHKTNMVRRDRKKYGSEGNIIPAANMPDEPEVKTEPQGQGNPHNNMPPWYALLMCKKQ